MQHCTIDVADARPLLVAICDPTRLAIDPATWSAAVYEGGVDLIQLRAPSLSATEIALVAGRILKVAPTADRVQINQHRDVAAALGTGVHLPERAGAVRPPLTPASRSVHSLESARSSSDFDFIVAGHIYGTPSKPGLPPRGIGWLAEIVRSSPVPVVAIGGVTAENAGEVMTTGTAGVAVIGALTSSDRPRHEAERLRQAIDRTWNGAHMQEHDTMIEITLNGKPANVPAESSIHELLQDKELAEKLVVVELNGSIVPRSDFGETRFSAGDQVEIVHFVGGGSFNR